MLFDYEWWFGTSYRSNVEEAKLRCTRSHFPKVTAAKQADDKSFQQFLSQVDARTIIYLRDGFSYELKELIERKSTLTLTFECTPAEEVYKLGAFVIGVPFEEIVRVEVFAFHPKEKPEDMPSIKGFSSVQVGPPLKRVDERTARSEAPE